MPTFMLAQLLQYPYANKAIYTTCKDIIDIGKHLKCVYKKIAPSYRPGQDYLSACLMRPPGHRTSHHKYQNPRHFQPRDRINRLDHMGLDYTRSLFNPP